MEKDILNDCLENEKLLASCMADYPQRDCGNLNSVKENAIWGFVKQHRAVYCVRNKVDSVQDLDMRTTAEEKHRNVD